MNLSATLPAWLRPSSPGLGCGDMLADVVGVLEVFPVDGDEASALCPLPFPETESMPETEPFLAALVRLERDPRRPSADDSCRTLGAAEVLFRPGWLA